MAELDTLVRVRRHSVEQKQKFLAELYRHEEALKKQRDELETQLAIEHEKTKNMDAEFLRFFSDYAGRVRHDIADIDNSRAQLDVSIKTAQEDMREAFAELKKVEIVGDRRKAERRAELNKKDADALDEIAIDGFRRKDD